MKKYKYDGDIFELIEQVDGFIEDSFEGCLIDNLLISYKDGFILALETYQNCWSSIYTLYLSDDSNEIYPMWDELAKEA